MIDKLKILLGISDNSKDDHLQLILDLSIEFVRNYTHREDICHMTGSILKLALYTYNNSDSMGISSESYSSVSYSYSDEVPLFIIDELKPLRKIKMI